MSDITPCILAAAAATAEGANPTPAPAPVVQSPVKSLLVAVSEKLATAGGSIRESVISRLAQIDIDKRANALFAGIETAVKLNGELNKIDRPDVPANLNAAGQPVGEGLYTKARLEAIKKLKEKIAKVEAAIAAATEKADWSKLLTLKIDDAPATNSGAAPSSE